MVNWIDKAGRRVVMGTVCGALALASACNTGSSGGSTTGPVNVPLMFKPDVTADATPVPMGAPRVFIKEVTDDRVTTSVINAAPTTMPAGGGMSPQAGTAPVQIGTTTKGGMFPVYDIGTPPTQFVHDSLADQLTKHGVLVVNDAAQANRILAVSIKLFSADEENSFKGNVSLMVTVMDKAGATLATIPATGDDSSWGHDREPGKYGLVLSNSMVKLTTDLMKNSMFTNQLAVQPGM